MARFDVKPHGLSVSADTMDSIIKILNTNRNEIESVCSSIQSKGAYAAGIKSSLKHIADDVELERNHIRQVRTALVNANMKYVLTEEKLVANALIGGLVIRILPNGIRRVFGNWKAAVDFFNQNKLFEYSKEVAAVTGATEISFLGGEFEEKWGIFNAEFEAEAGATIGLDGVEAKAGAKAKASLFTAESSFESKYAAADIEMSSFAAEAYAETQMKINKDGVMAAAAAGVSAVVLTADYDARLGTEDYNLYTEASGSVLGVETRAKAEMGIGKNGFKAKTEVGAEAYIAKGEVKGGLTIMGIKIGATVEGMIGVQAEAKAEVSSSELNAGIGLGPIEVDLEIDWSDFELPGLDYLENLFK